MKLGTIIEWLDDISEFRHLTRLADELGYDVIAVGDTPPRAYEVYVSLAIAAQETRNAVLAPMVTTPFLRHPATTAISISSIYELTGGRAVLGIGNGGSAPRVVGRWNGANHAELRDYVAATKTILNGGSAHFDDRDTEPLERVRPVPVFLAADHPKSIRLAAELADGIVITVGMSLEPVEQKVAAVREAVEQAGRDPGSFPIWGFSFAAVAGSRLEANTEIATALASDIAWRLRSPRVRATVPGDLLPAVAELERRYDMMDHTVGGKNGQLLAELGLLDYAASRTGVTGTVEEVAVQLKRLEALGVSCFIASTPANADRPGFLRDLRRAADLA
jgi:5,10-methylenetetrahydromethanopterin reductase